MKSLDVEFTRMIKDIKLPEGEGLEAAAANFGAQRAAVAAPAAEPAAAAAPAAAATEHSFGVDPVSAADLGETKEQREEDVRQQQRELEEEDEEEEELC